MLQAAVLSLCVLPDDHDVNVSVACPHAWQRLAVHHVGIQIQSGAAETAQQEEPDGLWEDKTPLLHMNNGGF